MMFGVLAATWARDTGDAELLEYAARQPRLYASLLQDPGTGLFSHAWWKMTASPYPRPPLFWARGNAWVMAALPRILEALPEGHPEAGPIKAILARTAAALLPLQRDDGWWDSLLASPGRNYRESSATALIASGFLHCSRRAWLPGAYGEAGLKAYASLVEALGPEDGGPSLPEVSAPTIPLPVFPRLGYALVPRRPDLGYGLAGLFLAAIEAERHGE
jgi:unsaturated rhamnogalacturonyl hydrolase